MKILYLTTLGPDYLQDSVLIGLRNRYGQKLIDYPKKEILYKTYSHDIKKLYGRGFSYTYTLDDLIIDRENIYDNIYSGKYTHLVFGSIWRQREICDEIISRIPDETKIIFIDGEDHDQVIEKLTNLGEYYKRENFSHTNVKAINFGITKDRILKDEVDKTKMFAKHNQCEESYRIELVNKECVRHYAFDTEEEYYNDLRTSKYGFTMKKAGWDCMRHYELAINGCVPCFYKLNEKPKLCAPHGLQDMINVISFSDSTELIEKIHRIENNNLYEKMRLNVLEWAMKNSCESVSNKIINEREL